MELDKRAAALFWKRGDFASGSWPGGAGLFLIAIGELKDISQWMVRGTASRGQGFSRKIARGGLMKKGNAGSGRGCAARGEYQGGAEPHVALRQDFHGDPESRAKELKIATSLEPRNADYWQELAWAQEDGGQYSDADKSWKMAERNAASDEERATFHKQRLGLEQREVQVAIEERKHAARSWGGRHGARGEAKLRPAFSSPKNAANKRAGRSSAGNQGLTSGGVTKKAKKLGRRHDQCRLPPRGTRPEAHDSTGHGVAQSKLMIRGHVGCIRDRRTRAATIAFACGGAEAGQAGQRCSTTASRISAEGTAGNVQSCHSCRNSIRVRTRLKRLLFRLLGKDPEAIIVSFRSGEDSLAGAMCAEMRQLEPNRRHFEVSLDGVRETRERFRQIPGRLPRPCSSRRRAGGNKGG